MYLLTDGNGKVLQYPYHPDMLRYAHPNISFPANMSDAQMAEWNVFEVAQTPIPTFNSLTHKIREVTPIYDSGWKQAWTVEALEDYDADQARREALDALRAERNARLRDCDWTQMPDAPLTESQRKAYAVYRQQLRDVPENTADLLNPVWPAEPKVKNV